MENMLKKKFINEELGIEFESYIDEECCVWFKAKNVAQILGYKNTEHAIKRHVSENHKKTFLLSCPPETGGQQNDARAKYCIFVDEPGFYELVFRSRLPAAKIFREWVFSEVLPSIRKYGYFKIIDSRIKQRFIIDGKKYYKHPVFSNYAANKNGEVINVKRGKNMKMNKVGSGYLQFSIYNKKIEKRNNYYQHRFVYEVFKGVIPRFFEIDHINNLKTDNQIKNLQLLTHKQNIEKSHSKPIISINIETGKEKNFNSIQAAAIKLDINFSSISKICRNKNKTATSKKDGNKYTFKFLD